MFKKLFTLVILSMISGSMYALVGNVVDAAGEAVGGALNTADNAVSGAFNTADAAVQGAVDTTNALVSPLDETVGMYPEYQTPVAYTEATAPVVEDTYAKEIDIQEPHEMEAEMTAPSEESEMKNEELPVDHDFESADIGSDLK